MEGKAYRSVGAASAGGGVERDFRQLQYDTI